MLRLLAFSLILLSFCAGGAWLAAHPGQVVLSLGIWRVETSAAFLLLLTVLLAGVMTALILLLRLLVRSPHQWRKKRAERQYALGVRALTHSMVALLEHDTKAAEKALKRAENHLHDAPITLLLRAQLARLEKNDASSQTALEAMLTHAETKRIATKHLSEYHDRRGNGKTALPLAEQALAMRPKDVGALRTLISTHLHLGQWQQAISIIQRARSGLQRAEKNRLLALVYHSKALALEAEGEFLSAYSFAKSAVRHQPAFAPAVALLASLAEAHHEPHVAGKAIAHAWKIAPHMELAASAMRHWQSLSHAAALKAAEKLTQPQKDHEESHLLMAKTALAARAWDAARTHLKASLALRESARACQLMAALEAAQYNDAEASSRWQLRAGNAEANPEWVCGSCAHVAAAWHAHCPRCNAFDSMEFKRRGLALAAA